MSVRANLDSKLPKYASMKTQMKRAGKQQIGSDLGKLPGTLIMPPSNQLPSWLKWRRYKIHMHHIYSRAKDFVSYVPHLELKAYNMEILTMREQQPDRLHEVGRASRYPDKQEKVQTLGAGEAG
jgi:hypothetical protein